MENASKSLIMAAEVLIGVMIISIAVYLFSVFGNFSKETNDRIVADQLAQFNEQFLKYTGTKIVDETEEKVTLTIHDIVNLANLARKYNKEGGLKDGDYTENGANDYIKIDLKIGGKSYESLEQEENATLVKLLKDQAVDDYNGEEYLYYCNQYFISTITGRIYYMKFMRL